MTRIAAGLAASVFAILTVSAAGAVAKDATPPGDETTTATQPGAPGEQATRRAPEPKAGLSLTLVDYDGRTAPTEADAIDVGTSGPVLVRIKNTGEVPLEYLKLTTAVAHGTYDHLGGFVCPPAMFDPKANVTLAVGETIECGGFVTPIPGGPKAVVTGKVVATVEGAGDIVEAAAAYWAYTPAAPTKPGLSLTLVDYDGRTAPTEADAIDVGTSGPVLVRIKNTGEVPLEHLELTTAVAHGADDYLVGFVCPPAMFDPKANVTLAVGETIECGGFVTPIPGGPKAVVTGKVVATVEGASDIVEAAAAYWAYTPAAPTKPAAGAPTKPAAGAPATPATRTLPETGAGGAGLYAGIAAALAAAGVTVTVLMARVRRPR